MKLEGRVLDTVRSLKWSRAGGLVWFHLLSRLFIECMSNRREIVLSKSVAQVVETQVASGRCANFSAAAQDVAWNFFIGQASPY